MFLKISHSRGRACGGHPMIFFENPPSKPMHPHGAPPPPPHLKMKRRPPPHRPPPPPLKSKASFQEMIP